jgi:hypothetical protein
VNRNSAGTTSRSSGSGGGNAGKDGHSATQSIHSGLIVHDGLTAAQQAAQEQMRRALEEDQYSAVGSIVDTESDDEDDQYAHTYSYRGSAVRLDKAAMIQAVRKYILFEQRSHNNSNVVPLSTNHDDDDDDDDVDHDDEDDDDDGNHPDGLVSGRRSGSNHQNMAKKKKKRKDELSQLQDDAKLQQQNANASKDPLSLDADDDLDRDGGSIFGATTGSSNSTWVECDKCKKWRRLRGVVDEKKLPSKWYCSMNKNDPERARCSAPEEEYETSHTPESAADSRTRKHLRVWVRRIQCNEAYESRQPTLTRGKKRNAVSSTCKDPYEWVRCCNPSCGKWRALLRIMDAKGNVVDRTTDNEWYCVMNNWDEKTASCAAPQENLPAVGCPPWVVQDNNS